MIASREVLAGEAGAEIARVSSLGDRQVATGALLCLVLLAIGLRLVPILIVPSTDWADEIFQSTEQAHRLVYGYGLVPWEFQLGMRSWLLPGAVAGLMELARLVGDGPDYYLPAIAIGLGLIASAPVVCCFLWCRRWFGLAGAIVAAATVAVAPELVFFGARALNEVVAAHLLVIAFYVLEPGYRVLSRRRLMVGGILLGAVFLLRIHLAPGVAIIALWSAGGRLALSASCAGWRRPGRAGDRSGSRLADARLSAGIRLAQHPLQCLSRRQFGLQRGAVE